MSRVDEPDIARWMTGENTKGRIERMKEKGRERGRLDQDITMQIR